MSACIKDVQEMMNEFIQEKNRDPSQLEVSVITYTQLRGDIEMHRHLSRNRDEDFFRICGLEVVKNYDIKGPYLKVS